MEIIRDLTCNVLILAFRMVGVTFLLIYPIGSFMGRLLLRPWVLSTIGQGISLTLKPLRNLRQYQAISAELSYAKTPLLLPPPEPPRCDLNQATVEDLRGIDGVGFVKVLEIVEYRERFGDYRRLEELGMIPGIGAKTIHLIGDRYEVK